MIIEVNAAERDVLAKILDTYLADLRQTIAATQRGTSDLHAEEDLIKGLQAKVSPAA